MKKILRNVVGVFVLFIGMFSLTGCFNEKYSVKVETVTNGAVTVDKQKAKEGEEVTITVAPNKDYKLEKVTANGKNVNCSKDNVCKVTMPSEDVNIKASIVPSNQYNITINSAKNGKIEVGKSYALADSEVELTVTEDEGYKLSSLLINDEEKIDACLDNVCKFIMPSEDVVVEGTFEEKEIINVNAVKVTFESKSNNATLKSGYQTPKNYEKGDQVDLSAAFTLSEGYFIDSYVVNGVKTTKSYYTLGNEDVVVSVNVIKGVVVTFVGIENAPYVQKTKYYKPNTTILLENTFNIKEGYLLNNYTVDGKNINGNSYALGTNDIKVSLKIEKGIKISYVVENGEHGEVVKNYGYYRKNDVITLKEQFKLEEDYYVEKYIIGEEDCDQVTYVVTEEEVTITAVLAKYVKIKWEYTGQHDKQIVIINTGYEQFENYKAGEKITINQFVVDEEYYIHSYTINGEVVENIEEGKLTIPSASSELVVSIILAKKINIKFEYKTDNHVTVKKDYEDGLEYNTLDDLGKMVTFDDKFDIEEGYAVDYYTVNGAKVDYKQIELEDKKLDIVVSVVVVKIPKVTATAAGVTNASVNPDMATKYYEKGTKVDLKQHFVVEDGYYITTCIITSKNPELPVNDCMYTVEDEDIEVTVMTEEIGTVEFTLPNTGLLLNFSCQSQILSDLKVGDTFSFDCFDMSYSVSGYIDYYTLNGEKIEDADILASKQLVFTGKAMEISVVVKNKIVVHFDIVEHATTNLTTIHVNPNETKEIDLEAAFTPDTGYVIDYYTVDGVRQPGEVYRFVPEDMEILISVVLKLA